MLVHLLNFLFQERGGSSRQAILKYIAQNYKLGSDEKLVNAHLKMALKAGVKNGTLKQSKGIGASGSFKLGNDKDGKETKEVAKGGRSQAKARADQVKKTAKKPKAKTAAKPTKPKASPTKKAAEKKTAIKPKTTKKEIKKPAAKRVKAKAVASPKVAKKTAKPAAKSKKPVAKGKK